jgi:hypothetical protein
MKWTDERADAVSQVEGYRIFNFRGKLKVIAVPFIEGRHYPQSKEQLLLLPSISRKCTTKDLSMAIYDLNIVFTEKPEDPNFDFDFGVKTTTKASCIHLVTKKY